MPRAGRHATRAARRRPGPGASGRGQRPRHRGGADESREARDAGRSPRKAPARTRLHGARPVWVRIQDAVWKDRQALGGPRRGLAGKETRMRLTIERMTYGPDAIAHTQEGKTVFVSGAIAGDVVEAELVSDGKSFSKARATAVLEPSPARVGCDWPLASVLGCAPWAAMAYDAQARGQARQRGGRPCPRGPPRRRRAAREALRGPRQPLALPQQGRARLCQGRAARHARRRMRSTAQASSRWRTPRYSTRPQRGRLPES